MANNDFWIAFAANLPLVLGLFTALQRGWIVVGRTFDRERADWLERCAQERADKQAAEARLEAFRQAMSEQADIMERAVALSEKWTDGRSR